MAELRVSFVEFLNRVGDIVMFKPLSMDEIVKIIELQLRDIENEPNRNISLNVTDRARSSSRQPPIRRFTGQGR